MRLFFRFGFVVLLLVLGISSVYAQDEDFIKEEGEVVEGEFLINKDLKITLPAAQRIFRKVPPEAIDAKETEPLQYTFKDYTPQLKDINTRLRVLKLKDEKFTTRPGSYLTLGIGNYLTPYLEAALNSSVKKNGFYGVKLNHISSQNGPVDDSNSGDSRSGINLYGKSIGNKASIEGDIGYNRDGYHFYGYDPGTEVERDTIQQVFNDIKLGFTIRNSDIQSPVKYGIYGEIYQVSDDFDASEFGAKTGFQTGFELNEFLNAKLDFDFLYLSYKNQGDINRSLVRLYPSFIYENNGLKLDVGLKVVNYNDTLNLKNNTKVYPAISLGYNLSDDIMAYGQLEGDVEEVTFRTITGENPYVKQNISISHTGKSMDIKVGVRGNLVHYLGFDVGIRSAVYKNLYFYTNDPIEFNKFDLVYDTGNTSLFQGLLSLSYFKNKTLGSTFSARFNAYNTNKIAKAWHRPKFELDYSFWYNFYDKVKVTTDLFILTGIEAIDSRGVDPISTTLDPSIDLNVKVDYILSDKYSLFVNLNNLLNNNYQIYHRYPVRGLLAIVGLSVSF